MASIGWRVGRVGEFVGAPDYLHLEASFGTETFHPAVRAG